MLQNTKAMIFAMAVIFGSVLPAKASDPFAILALQFELKAHGFDVGEPDGKIGKKTRSAIQGFADRYNAPINPDELITYMVRRHYATFEPITDDATIELIRVGVGKELKDPDSAKVRNLKRVTAADGSKFICGEVNGKNSYGAYAGFVPFRSYGNVNVTNPFQISTPYSVEKDGSTFVFWMCKLSFPRQ